VDFAGVFPILATPFTPNEDLDLESFAKLVKFMAEDVRVNGVTILGVLGESNRLTDKERERLITTAVQVAGNTIPIVVGTSHSGTRATCELSQMAQELGASAVMVTPNREPTPNDDKVFEYFQRVGEAISIPIVLQDHPASTLVHMPVSLITKIANSVPRVACIKAEAPPTPTRVSAIKNGLSRPVKIVAGLGALYGMFELRSGCDGFMTGFAFPEVLQSMVFYSRKGEYDKVQRIYQTYLPLIVFEQQPGVAIRKEFLRRRGLIAHSTVRHPGAGVSNEAAEHITTLLKGILSKHDIRRVIPLNDL